MSNTIQNVPNSSVLINSMRSIGYDFESAVADIVDNAIAAKAHNVELLFPASTNEPLFLEIIDDGIGMDRDELFEAMRFGSIKKDTRDREDLGRFGLGLKTASISQCKRFTAISKKQNDINAFLWDIDLLNDGSNWEMNELTEEEIRSMIPKIDLYLDRESFTIILWEKFDKLIQEINLFNDIYDIFLKKMTLVDKHLSLIYHRYLEKDLRIMINGNIVKSIDPFLTKHPKTITKIEQAINTKTSEGNDEKVIMQVFILPFHKDLSREDYDTIGGQDSFDEQGFYVYRNKRLMIYGTWFRIKPKNELSRNARIRVDIPNTLDDLWSIDIKKQKAIIPAILLDQLRGEVADAITKSKQLYRYQGDAQTKTGSLWCKNIDERDKSIKYEINLDSEIISNIVSMFDDKDMVNLKRLIELIQLALPYTDIFNSVSEKREINAIDESQYNSLFSQALSIYEDMKKTKNISNDKIVDLICQYEPFNSAGIINQLKEKIHG